MSTDATPLAPDPIDPPPPSEAQRAIRAALLGVALGVALALLGRTRATRS